MWRVATHEIVALWRDGRTRAAAAIVLVLLMASTVAGWVETRRVERERSASRATMREQWIEQGTKNPHSAAHFGIHAIRPRGPLSWLDSGVDPYAGVAIWLEAHKQNQARYRPVRDTTVAGRAGQTSAALLVQLVVPLLIVMLVAPAIADERDRGTLAMLLATGVPRGRLMAGKLVGISTALLMLFGPVALAGASLVLRGSEGAVTDLPLRIAGLAAAYGAYFLVFILLGLAVSALSGQARLALTILAIVWAVNVIVPRAMSDVARRVAPLPSTAELQAAIDVGKRQGLDGHNPAADRLEAVRQATLARYGVSSLDALPVNFDGILLDEDERYGNLVYDRVYARLWRRMAEQERVHLAGVLLGPLPAVQRLSQALAGTDWAHQRHFADAAEAYRRAMLQTMNDHLTYRSVSRAYGENVMGADAWAAQPDFVYQPLSMREIAPTLTAAIAWLAGWVLVGLVLVIAAARRLRAV
jgi:ABC-2 type transport system permease protein